MKQWLTKLLRTRTLVMLGGSLAVIAYLLVSDPAGGSLTLTFLAKLATPVIAVLFAHIARKAFFDYIDLEAVFKRAIKTSIGAGLVFLGACIVIFGLLGLFGSQVYAQPVATYVPPQAHQHLPTLVQEQKALWADHPNQHTWLV